MKYPMNIARDADYLLLTLPDIPELTSIAYTEDDIQSECLDAFELSLDFYTDAGRPIPLPSKVKSGEPALVIPSTLAAKIFLYNEWLKSGIDKGDLADRIGYKRPAVSRLFNFKYKSKMEAIEKALEALGKHIEIRVA